MRKRIFDFVEVTDGDDFWGKTYDIFMIGVIILSLFPIALKSTKGIIGAIDLGTAIIFIIDYILRLSTADYKLKKGAKSFMLYPFTPMAVIDLMAILPSLMPVHGAFRMLRTFRLLRALRVFRVFKVMRYSKSITIIMNVLRKQREALIAVCCLAVGYILISALIMISIEPETFDTFFDAVYWATVSLTTVGYGDIYAVSTAGKLITMISAVFGVAIVALPAGIVTAGYMEEVRNKQSC